MRRSWLLLPFLIATAAQGQNLSDFQRVLIPVYLPVPVGGAFGTAWSTQTILFADSAVPIRILPGCDGSMFCEIQPRTSFFLENSNPARFSARLRRSENNAPCEPLPVARETDFKSRIVLPFVPMQNGRAWRSAFTA